MLQAQLKAQEFVFNQTQYMSIFHKKWDNDPYNFLENLNFLSLSSQIWEDCLTLEELILT